MMTGFMYLLPMRSASSNGEYFVDETGDGVPDYSFGNPDFNFVQFRSNLVLRWEYKARFRIICCLVAEEIHRMHLAILTHHLAKVYIQMLLPNMQEIYF